MTEIEELLRNAAEVLFSSSENLQDLEGTLADLVHNEDLERVQEALKRACDALTDTLDAVELGRDDIFGGLQRFLGGFQISEGDPSQAERFETRLLRRFTKSLKIIPDDFWESFYENCGNAASFSDEDAERAVEHLRQLKATVCQLETLASAPNVPAVHVREIAALMTDGGIFVADATVLVSDLTLLSAFTSVKSIGTSGMRIAKRLKAWREEFSGWFS